MKKTAYLLLLSLSAFACHKDMPVQSPQQSQYTMQFNITASGAPLIFGQTVTNGTTRYYLDFFRFYMGFPRLVKTDGTEVPLANIEIVKFDNQLPDNPVMGRSFNFSVPAGDYKAIRFGVGLPPKIKDTVAHGHGGIDPLNDAYGLHWTLLSSKGLPNMFRDVSLYMYVDTSKAQNQPPKRYIEFHVLEDDTTINLYHELEFPESFTVNNGDNHTTTFNLDANNIFFNSANPIDLRHVVSTSMTKGNATEINLGIKFNDNVRNSISKQ